MDKTEYHAAEFARLAGIPKKTLLYYDEIGLFRPARVEPNGYRVYSWYQLDRLALIAALRDLGVPLRQIREYLTHSDPERLDAMLAQQSAEIDRRMEQLRRRREMLEGLRAQNAEFLRWCGRGPVLLERPPQRMTVLLTPEQMKGPHIVNYLTDGLYTGVCQEKDELFLYQRREDGERLLPGGPYLCLYEAVRDQAEHWKGWTERLRARLESSAAAQGLRLGQALYVEFNELTPEGTQGETPLRVGRIPVLMQSAATQPDDM
ncbi:MAG: MerR family transcriptional regulator [Faecalibacterium sp.]